MVQIGNKEIVFSTSFITNPGESALIVPNESTTFNMRISAVEKVVPADDPNRGIEIAVNGIEFSIKVPFLRGGASQNAEMTEYARTPTGKLTFRLVLQSIGLAMLVHVDILHEITA